MRKGLESYTTAGLGTRSKPLEDFNSIIRDQMRGLPEIFSDLVSSVLSSNACTQRYLKEEN